ncbi:MAG: PAS domain S-box protein [Bacteroidales bacterium]|jgi:PAS domain S-box-containing protein|nr:PAS domain S-box protein [Bacteroidales bacterium]
MSDRNRKYSSMLTNRNIGLYTLISFLFVVLYIFIASNKNGLEFSFSELIASSKSIAGILILIGLPIYVFLILLIAKRGMQKEIDSHKTKLDEISTLLEKNTEFAGILSYGDDPGLFPEILNSELGKSLKLIHLNIKSNRKKEKEIAWITEGKEIVSRILRLHNEIDKLSYQILKGLGKYINAVQGAMYLFDNETKLLKNVSVLAYNRQKYVDQVFQIGEGLVGQCAFEQDFIYRTEIPDDYISISTGILGEQKPKCILLIPLITNEELQGVLEFAFLDPKVSKLVIQFNLELGEIIARSLFNLRVNEKTRFLLEESRKMTAELQQNEQVLQENAEEMQSTQKQLQKANFQLQNKIKEEKLAQDRLHSLLENASEIISIYDDNFRLKYISPSVEHILGYSPEEMMKGKDFERIDQQSSKAIRKAFEQLRIAKDETARIEYTFARKDGTRIFLVSTIRNLLDDASIKGFIFNTRDITESKIIEKEQRLKFRMQSLSENSMDLIIRFSASGIIYYVNPVVLEYSGITPSEMLNKPLADIPFNKTMTVILEEAIHRMNHNPIKFNVEHTVPIYIDKKEDERILNFNVIPEFQENELETILFVGHDITEAKRIEKEINLTNRKMQDSINYAERIQSSILPSAKGIQKAFSKSFIYYLPKDVISGDFPWFYETEEAYYIAAVDCTGHGVPGALLSFIGFFLLNNITALNPDKSAGTICDELNYEVRKALKQDQAKPDTRDGMDLALCKVFKNENKLEYVGAHRPMYLLREGELTVFKGDRKAIGGLINPKRPETNFTTNEFDLRKGDKFFIFSDGLSDQMGGPDNAKYSPSRIRNILLDNPGFTINQFNDYFRQDFSSWLSGHKQLDDVLLIGIEF